MFHNSVYRSDNAGGSSLVADNSHSASRRDAASISRDTTYKQFITSCLMIGAAPAYLICVLLGPALVCSFRVFRFAIQFSTHFLAASCHLLK